MDGRLTRFHLTSHHSLNDLSAAHTSQNQTPTKLGSHSSLPQASTTTHDPASSGISSSSENTISLQSDSDTSSLESYIAGLMSEFMSEANPMRTSGSLADDDVNDDDDPRFHLTYKLLQAELDYQSSLLNVFHTYAEPLRKFSSLSSEDHQLIFRHVEPLLAFSTSLCRKLDCFIQTWDPGTTTIGQLFNRKMWTHYLDYLRHYRPMRQLLLEKRRCDEEFRELCQLRRGDDPLTLPDLLLRPVQRIAEYEGHLSELLTMTDPLHPDYPHLARATSTLAAMVKEQEDDLSHLENDHNIDNVQERFPNDDLKLQQANDKKSRHGRRLSSGAVIMRTLSKRPAAQGSPSVREVLPDTSSASPGSAHPACRVYILESCVQLTAGLQCQDRYFFLFNDLLLIAKQKSNTSFKLKQRIRVCEMWLASCLDDVSETSKPPDRSFVIGWPTTNVVATFATSELKELWLEKLKEQITSEKFKETPRAIILKVRNRDSGAYSACKCVTVGNNERAGDLVKRCLYEFHMQEAQPKDYQLWVVSSKEVAPYPLIGHEHPFSIKLSHVRDDMKRRGQDHTLHPVDVDFNANDADVQFVLRQTKKVVRKASFEDNLKRPKKNKKSPLINFFRRNQHKSDGVTESQGRLFKRNLADVWDDGLPKSLLALMEFVNRNAPYSMGSFRKPGNHKKCQELRQKLDHGHEVNWENEHVLVACSVFKEYLRTLPECLLVNDLYEEWLELLNVNDLEQRKQDMIRTVGKLPECNLTLLRHVLCILNNVCAKEDINNMNAQAVTVCISPSVIWSNSVTSNTGNALEDTVRQSEEAEKARQVMLFMLENTEEIFGPECLKLYGDEQSSPRSAAVKASLQDSSTDSDSMHSLRSAPDNTEYHRHDNMSIDSAERDSCFTEQEPSPQLGKAHLSPTNLSCDSGLTNSDPRLDDNHHDDRYAVARKPSMTRSVSQSDQKTKPDTDRTSLSQSYDSSLTSEIAESMPVPPPRNKSRQHNSQNTPHIQQTAGSQVPAIRPQHITLKHSSSAITIEDYRQQLESDDSLGGYLGSVDEFEDTSPEANDSINSLHELHSRRSGDIGILRKSSSGTKLYVRDDSHLVNQTDNPVVRRNSSKKQSSAAAENRRSVPPQMEDARNILALAKTKVHHSDSPSETNQFYTPSAKPSASRAPSNLDQHAPLRYCYSEQHLTSVPRNPSASMAIFNLPSSDSTEDESEEPDPSDFSYMVPVTKPDNQPKSMDHLTVPSHMPALKPESHSIKRQNAVTSLQNPQMSSTSPHGSPVAAERPVLKKTAAVEESKTSDGVCLRKKFMTAKGSDIFPSQITKNLYRQSLDEDLIMGSRGHQSGHAVLRATRSNPPRSTPVSPVITSPHTTKLEQSTSKTPIQGNEPVTLSTSGNRKSHHLPTYEEAIQRKNKDAMSMISDKERADQHQKNVLAQKLYADSVRKHSSERQDDTRSQSPNAGTLLRPPSYERACWRAEQIKEHKQLQSQLSGKSPKMTGSSNTVETRPAVVNSGTGDEAPAKVPEIKVVVSTESDKSSGTGLVETVGQKPSQKQFVGQDAISYKKQRRKSHERRIMHRYSDTKLGRPTDAVKAASANLTRSKSDSSDLIKRSRKYKDFPLWNENKENVSNEDLQVLEEFKKIKPLNKTRSVTPERSSRDKLGRITKERDNALNRKLNTPVSYKLLADKLAEQETPVKKKQDDTLTHSTRSIRNRNWHKELADQYKNTSEPVKSLPKYSYVSKSSSFIKPSEEKPKKMWTPPVHPTKDLVISYSANKDVASRPIGQIRRARSSVWDTPNPRINVFNDSRSEFTHRPRSTYDSSTRPLSGKLNLEEKIEAASSQPGSTDSSDRSRSVSQLRSLYSEQTVTPPKPTSNIDVPAKSNGGKVTPCRALERINPHAEEEYV